ncbi:MAG: beta-lactamase family protein [Planctomycetes bacterium]|nr:beta-lactamase family protein [Planctomycetota bacterium]
MTSSPFLLAILVPLTFSSPLAVAAKETQRASTTQPAARDLGPVLEPLRTKADLPGVVAAVVEHGRVVAIGCSGVRKHGDSTPITVDDRMHLGSCTKAMTATLAARFVEAGKLRWDSKLAELFPGVEMKPAWRAVTLEQLLTNRAGAPADLDADGLWARLCEPKGTHVDQRRELLVGVVAREPVAPPGTKFLYSNAGFAIAGHALETLAKSPWEELMQKELFAPLGITTAGFGAPGTPAKLDQPLGHVGKHAIDAGPEADNPPAIGPAGTVHMSIADWAKFVALHVEAARARIANEPSAERGGTDGGTRPSSPGSSANSPGSGKASAETKPFLTTASFAKLHAVPEGAENDYAMGWGVASRSWADGPVLTHSGSNTMWFCVTWLAPKKDFAVLVCTNAGGDDAAKAVDGLVGAVLQDHLARSKPAAK